MLLRTVYTVISSGPDLEKVDVPLELSPAHGLRVRLEREDDRWRLVAERAVEAERLEVVSESGHYRVSEDGHREPLPRLCLRDDAHPEHVLVKDVANAVAFLTDSPVSLQGTRGEDRYLPEDEDEQALLERFGSDEPYVETSLLGRSRTFTAVVDTEAVTALLARSSGLRLYADAIALPLDVARLRELWRVLESAFGRTGAELVDLLSSYPPARQLKFDNTELGGLLVLRNRASHAQTKAGTRELIAVEQECRRKVGRLKNLVERVLLTKARWGLPTLGVQELAPLQAYIGLEGEQVLRREGKRAPQD